MLVLENNTFLPFSSSLLKASTLTSAQGCEMTVIAFQYGMTEVHLWKRNAVQVSITFTFDTANNDQKSNYLFFLFNTEVF